MFEPIENFVNDIFVPLVIIAIFIAFKDVAEEIWNLLFREF